MKLYYTVIKTGEILMTEDLMKEVEKGLLKLNWAEDHMAVLKNQGRSAELTFGYCDVMLSEMMIVVQWT